MFTKGFSYHYIQPFFTNIKIRIFISNIERKIFNKLYGKYFFQPNIDLAKLNCKLLEKRGATNKFELKNLNNYKYNIIKYFKNNKIFNDKRPSERFYLKDRDPLLKIGYYDLETTTRCPHIFDIINDDLILSTTSLFFKSPFKLTYASVWWSFKNIGEVKEKTQSFHRDLDNFNLLKFFIYLSDVDENSGANQYIKFSHNDYFNKKISRKTVSENELNDKAINNLYTFTGKSGSAIAANTFGLHRGKTPTTNDRLMLVLAFSLVGNFYGPPKPFLNLNEIITNKKKLNKFINKNYIF